MSVNLVIDHREKKLIALMDKSVFSTESLDIGDIQFRKDGEILLVIERKTITDLASSICDGRSREQKARLLKCGIQRERVMYIIEGNIDRSLSEKIGSLPVSTLLGSMINTQFKDGIYVYKTVSMEETANFLVKLLQKLSTSLSDYWKFFDKNISYDNSESDGSASASRCLSPSAAYAAVLKKKKKENMTPTVWFISQLSLIPQITETVADVIVAKYPSVSSLIREYEKTPEQFREKLLENMKYSIANGKKRRIGPRISSRIYDFFYNTGESTESTVAESHEDVE